jgi:Asp-tRNA(Asn)/Glu-tRNA(Gln) amidotransferase A subunit family amidase
LTGHPTVILPHGVTNQDGHELPTTITFTGQLYGEADLLTLAYAYERAIQFRGRPNMSMLRERAAASKTSESGERVK